MSGEYDCIVVDTPPSRSALDFLEAPNRLTDFVSARLLARLAGPRGVRQRAAPMNDLLRSRRTAFAVITTLDPEPFAEAEFLCAKLREYAMPLRAVVVNRVLPDSLLDPGSVAMANTLASDGELTGWLTAELSEPVAPEVLQRLGEAFLALHLLAECQAAQLARLGNLGRVPLARLPLADREVTDLEAVGALATWLLDGPG